MIDDQALLQLIYEGHERTNVDYKRSLAWDQDNKYNITKDVICFANAGGGYIVIGVDESRSTIDEKYTGISEADLKQWEVTKVSKTVNEFSATPIDFDLKIVPDEKRGKSFLVLSIPSHHNVPHICKKDKHDSKNKLLLRKGAIYCRTKDKSCEELSDPTSTAELMRRCALNDKDKLLKDFSDMISGRTIETLKVKQVLEPFAEMNKYAANAREFISPDVKELTFWEVICFPSEQLYSFQINEAQNALKEACVDYRGWPFLFYLEHGKVSPKYGDNVIFAISNEPFFGLKKFNYWVFDYFRGIFYSLNITDESALDKPKIFDPGVQRKIIAESCISQGRLFAALGLELHVPFVYALRYSNTVGIQGRWINEWGPRIPLTQKYEDKLIRILRETTLNRLLNEPEYVSGEITVEILHKMGYQNTPDPEKFVEPIKKYLSKGQKVT